MSDFSMADFREEMRKRRAPRDRSSQQCRGCGKSGHNRRTCPKTAPADRAESWAVVRREVVAEIRRRLASIGRRVDSDRVLCPRGLAFGPCPADCYCGGSGAVLIGFLRAHYERLLGEFSHA